MVTLPLVTPFQTSVFTEYYREALLVGVHTRDGAIGWGECAATAEPIYSAECIAGAVTMLRDELIPLVASLGEVSAEQANELFRKVPGNPMAKAALETAILDAQLREDQRSLADFLGAESTSVKAGVSVGLMPMDELLRTVDRYWNEEHYQRIKLKIEPGRDVERVRAVREKLGDEVPLQVDANGAYTMADADHLARLDEYDLLMIEQPFAEHDMAGHAALARRLRTRICLDEPITSPERAVQAIEQGAAQIINIKPGRVGGYLEARKIHDVCRERGIPVWVGGMLETGIGRAANIALAALPDFAELVGDLSASTRFFKNDITPPFLIENGSIPVPTAPGIGVDPTPDALTEAIPQYEWTAPSHTRSRVPIP
ncbi:o-succinylbenzoate synthase [Actinoplanes sp. NPDC051851]|uniref:o-succinylbenzoate synthase n=1 Tax=Actinoplanes sp. NPDC051851 TaxID=3154753 RepID=UPI0034320DAB